MAQVYQPLGAEGFELCHPTRGEDFETFNQQINGTTRRTTWQAITVRLIHVDEGKQLAISDSPWLGSHALIFRREAIEKLGALLEPHGEFLPLRCPDAELLVFNPTRVLDALDEQASQLTRFSGGRIMSVARYAFIATAIADADIFKIPNLRVSPTFLSERIVQAWRLAGLRGLEFKRIWSAPDPG